MKLVIYFGPRSKSQEQWQSIWELNQGVERDPTNSSTIPPEEKKGGSQDALTSLVHQTETQGS